MIDIFYKMVLFSCFLCIEGVAHGEENRFIFDKNEYDLGTLEEGRLLSFDIPLKNIAAKPLKIISLEPSCGCVNAVVINGSIGRGDTGIIRATINTTGKIGKIAKTIEVMTDISPTPFVLKLRGSVKHSGNGVLDAGAIFRGDCRRCHVGMDIKSKQGEMLYNAVCFMCHKDYSTHKHLSKGLLEKSISDGITNTSMPGFAETKGGPLSSEQISSLVNFLKNKK